MFVVTSAVEDRIQALNVKPDPRILNKTGDQSTGIPGVSSEDLAQSAGGSFFSSTVQQLRPLDVDLATPTELNKVTRKVSDSSCAGRNGEPTDTGTVANLADPCHCCDQGNRFACTCRWNVNGESD